jgi:hypothetical protein
MPHYFEFFLFGGLACILAVYILVYYALLFFGKQRRWRDLRQGMLTKDDATYHLKGYDAKPNVRRA